MEFQGKYCTIRVNITKNPIDTEQLPTLPPGWTVPSEWPFRTSTTTEQYVIDETREQMINLKQMLEYQRDMKEAKAQQQLSTLQHYVFGITGVSEPEPVESR